MAVIVSYIPTPEGRAALDFALRTARERGDSLRIADGSGGRHRLEHEEGQVPFDRVGELVEPTGVPYEVLSPAMAGVPMDEVVEAAVDDPTADVIVIGIRRRSAVGKFLLGSSAQRLILDAECPVTVVKTTAR
ncbi:universal stress protein [Georgenia subflava]|nr:universal stress protein [Georgenia subflava]